MSLQKWWIARKKKRAQKRLNAGFDYALGALVRGEKTPYTLRMEHFPNFWNSFDVGMEEAITYAILHELVKDDRF